MKKFILIIALILLVIWLGVSCIAKSQTASKEPSATQAPYIVQTTARLFYAQQVTGKVPNITVTGYWEKHGEKYVYYKGVLTFNSNVGKITVVRR